MEKDFIKTPCQHCPFRKDVKPFLHPKRGEEIAYHAQNPYNSFSCHKTTVSDEEFGGEGTMMVSTEESKECAGFLTLQINEGVIECPEGFTASENIYESSADMAEAYAEAYAKQMADAKKRLKKKV